MHLTESHVYAFYRMCMHLIESHLYELKDHMYTFNIITNYAFNRITHVCI